jgi:hypothetical protein
MAMAVMMGMKEVMGYATDVTSSNSIAGTDIIIVIFFIIRGRRGIMWLSFPAVAAIENIVDDFLCRMLVGLTAPRSSQDTPVEILQLSGVAWFR